jgi:hypothetical protein
LVEFRTRITESGILQVPRELMEVFGQDMKMITGTTAAILFPAGISYEDVMRSLEIIRADLQFRLSRERAKAKAKPSGNAATSRVAKVKSKKNKNKKYQKSV